MCVCVCCVLPLVHIRVISKAKLIKAGTDRQRRTRPASQPASQRWMLSSLAACLSARPNKLQPSRGRIPSESNRTGCWDVSGSSTCVLRPGTLLQVCRLLLRNPLNRLMRGREVGAGEFSATSAGLFVQADAAGTVEEKHLQRLTKGVSDRLFTI